MTISVVIPTRNRPEKLGKCLLALQTARERICFEIVVCDSSEESLRPAISAVCSQHAFVRLLSHNGKNAAAARNFCAQVASGQLLVSIDDDVYVEPDAILKLVDAYHKGSGPRVIYGSVAWGNEWSGPIVMRPIGYGRSMKPGEVADFMVSAFFLYPRSLALAMPWNEHLRSSEDRFMGAACRAANVAMIFEAQAKAHHDQEHNTYSIDHQAQHIYANLFDAIIANPRLDKAFCFEVLGFLAGIKLAFKQKVSFLVFFRAWLQGHKDFVRDWQYLQTFTQKRYELLGHRE